MNNRHYLAAFALLCCIAGAQAQQAFNQNSSRSNHTRRLSSGSSSDWSLGVHSGAAFSSGSSESNLFRGNGFTTRISGDYFPGMLGFGISSGFLTGNISNTAVNSFIRERNLPSGVVSSTSNPFNAFLLAGPSLRLGQNVQLLAHLKGGIFLNQGGSLSIGQQGAIRPLYRFESGGTTIQPGFGGGIAISYPLGNGTALTLNADLLRSYTSVQILDPQQGIDIPAEQKKNMQVFTTGIAFVKLFNSNREVRSPLYNGIGQPGRRKKNPVRNTDPDADNDGVSILQPENGRVAIKRKGTGADHDRPLRYAGSNTSVVGLGLPQTETGRVAIKTKGTGADHDRPLRYAGSNTGAELVSMSTPACGPVTRSVTHPDGSTETMEFTCPEDAAAYERATVPKQTQGATFGERVNAGPMKSIQDESSESFLLAGRLRIKPGPSAVGIVTNQSILTTHTATIGPTLSLFGGETTTGRASGQRTYQPIYNEHTGAACTSCPAASVAGNPIKGIIVKGGRNVGADSISNARSTGGKKVDDDCDGIGGITVNLLDESNGSLVASTVTDACGNFWFAGVPNGSYAMELEGELLLTKSYNVNVAANSDVVGAFTAGYEVMELAVEKIERNNKSRVAGGGNTGNTGQPKANINTSRSNTKGTVFTGADTDGDGQHDRFQVFAIGDDGRSSPLTVTVTKTSSGYELEADLGTTPAQRSNINTSRANIKKSKISFGVGTTMSAKVQFSDGSTRDVTFLTETAIANGVWQAQIQLGDSDGDGMADYVWSPRSNLAVASTGSEDLSSKQQIQSNADVWVKELPLAIGTEAGMMAGNQGGQGGAPAARPGNPIRGMTVKGGRNPGGDIVVNARTNASGEFVWLGVQPGAYHLTVEQRYSINDISIIELGETADGRLKAGKGDVKITASHNSQSLRTGGSSGPVKDNSPKLTASQNSQELRTTETPPIRWKAPELLTNTCVEMLGALDVLEAELNATGASERSGINTSRSNIKNLRNTINAILSDAEAGDAAGLRKKSADMNMQFLALQESLKQLGEKYQSISNVLKTKHDTVKNSIQNVR